MQKLQKKEVVDYISKKVDKIEVMAGVVLEFGVAKAVLGIDTDIEIDGTIIMGIISSQNMLETYKPSLR